MNFDDALKHYLPRVWFRFKFFKYKHLRRGEAELWLIRHLVQRGTTAIDVGASVGFYAAEMARYAGKVIAFEAIPHVAALTTRVAPRNVEVVNVALSSHAGRTILKIPLNAKGRAVTELASLAPKQPSDEFVTIGVETRRLDEFPISDCGLIKIDVEGHEEAVLDGASALIAAQRPVLMIELVAAFNPGVVARLAERYAALSYNVFFLKGGGLKPIAEFEPARDQDEALLPSRQYVANFLFIPQEKQESILARLA